MSKTQSKLGITVNNNCTPVHLTLTETLGAPGNDVFLSVDGITNIDYAWDDWVWQTTDIYVDPKVWTNVQTGGVSYTILTDDTAVRVIFTRGGCDYFSNISGFPETLFNVPFNVPRVQFSNGSETFTGGAGVFKVDFSLGGVLIDNQSNGLLTTSVVNDNFVSALSASKWQVSFSGYTSTAAGANQEFAIGVHINGTLYDPSYTTLTYGANGDYYPFGRTFFISLATTDTVDIRVDKLAADLTVGRLVLTLTQVA